MITMIAAVASNGVIGAKGKGMLWRISKDFQHFVELTTPHPVIMSRVTYETIPPKFRPLKDRLNVVVTRDEHYEAPTEVLVCHDVDEAVRLAQKHDENIFIAGGGTIYSQLIDKADALEITEVHQPFEGDVIFPLIDLSKWKEVSRKKFEGPINYSFVRYERI